MKIRFLFLLSAFVLCCASGGAVETTIKGDRMELIDKGKEVVFSGSVRLKRGSDVVQANEMRTDKSREKVTAIGNVRLFRKTSSTETWRGSGERGTYDTKSGAGSLMGKSKRAYLVRTEIISSTMTRVLEIWGERIDFHNEAQTAKAKGRVQGKTNDPETKDSYEFFAGQADYHGKKRRLVLSGTPPPIVTQKGGKTDKKVTGRVIIYEVDADRMISEGDAEAVITDYPQEEREP